MRFKVEIFKNLQFIFSIIFYITLRKIYCLKCWMIFWKLWPGFFWQTFHMTNVPYDKRSVWQTFLMTSVPFLKCIVMPIFFITSVLMGNILWTNVTDPPQDALHIQQFIRYSHFFAWYCFVHWLMYVLYCSSIVIYLRTIAIARREITSCGVIDKSPIFLSHYWKQ